MTYYLTIIALSCFALVVLSVLVKENGRLSKTDKHIMYFSYFVLAVSALAEMSGVMLSGNTDVPAWIIKTAKFADYTLTPLAGGIIVLQLRNKSIIHKLIIGTLAVNTVLQFISIFTGWIFTVDETNHYAHGQLYILYMISYLIIIVLSILEFGVYGKKFSKQNRLSLYGILAFVIIGVAAQEILGGSVRTAYISLTIGMALMFIHFTEYSQIAADDRIHRQMIQITTDPLTGVSNRYAYNKVLNEKASGKLPEKTVVFSIDINNLKNTNDTLGHNAGDELICGAADSIRNVFDDYGNCYRTGGDEFIVLTEIDDNMAAVLIARLKKKTSEWHGKTVPELSLSVGSASASDNPGIDIENLIFIADKEMYKEKSAYYTALGRDRRKH